MKMRNENGHAEKEKPHFLIRLLCFQKKVDGGISCLDLRNRLTTFLGIPNGRQEAERYVVKLDSEQKMGTQRMFVVGTNDPHFTTIG